MKKNGIMFLASTILLFLLVSSCSNKEDSFSPYYYSLKIRFADRSGNDKVRGIDYIENSEAENNTYEIAKSVYKLDVTQTGKPKEELFLSPLCVQKNDSYDCLVLTTSTLALPDYRPAQLTHKLVCSYIFGDDDEHTITSNWEEKNSVLSLCTNIIVDGRTFPVIETDQEGTSVFLVVFDE